MIPSEIMQQVRRIQIRTNRMVNEILAGQYESVFKGQGMEFKEVRAYVPGDDIRSIDWNVTARTGHPHVKVLEEERELTVMLVVDASASGQFGSLGKFKNELAAEMCAVIAFSAIKNNDKVGLIVFTDQVELVVPPGKGRKHVLRVIREVLHFEPQGRGTDIAQALHYLNSVQRRRAVVFLVSDYMDENYELALRIANRKHDVIAITVTDPVEEVLVDVGLAQICDPETGKQYLVNVKPEKSRQGYAKKKHQWMLQRDEIFRRTKVDVMHVRTDKPYVDEIYKFFRMRERRMA